MTVRVLLTNKLNMSFEELDKKLDASPYFSTASSHQLRLSLAILLKQVDGNFCHECRKAIKLRENYLELNYIELTEMRQLNEYFVEKLKNEFEDKKQEYIIRICIGISGMGIFDKLYFSEFFFEACKYLDIIDSDAEDVLKKVLVKKK